MTEELEKAWRSSAKPFHNDTVYTEEPVPITALQPLVRSILQHISFCYCGRSLFLFDDWHADDGFIVSATPVSIGELAGHVAKVESLYNWRQGDFEVYRAIYPQGFDFLLRINVLDEMDDPEQYPGNWGSMSFSGHGFDLHQIRKRGRAIAGLKLAQTASKAYFDRIYAG